MFFSKFFSKSKLGVTGDTSSKIFCKNCRSFFDDLSIKYCPICGWWGGREGHTIRQMTSREEQGYFLDEALIPKYDEDDKNYGLDLNVYFENLESTFWYPSDSIYPDEIKKLMDEYQNALTDYIQSIRSYALKPTYYDVCVELDNRLIDFHIKFDRLCDKYGYEKPFSAKLKHNDQVCSITMWNRRKDSPGVSS